MDEEGLMKDYVGLSFVFLIRPIPEKKKIAPKIAYTKIIRMLWPPDTPFAKRTAARISPTTPITDNMIPRMRFSILLFMGNDANQVPPLPPVSINTTLIDGIIRNWISWQTAFRKQFSGSGSRAIGKSPFPAGEIPKKVTTPRKFLHIILKLLFLHSIDNSNKKS